MTIKKCSIKNCGRKEVAKGLCITHRMRLIRYGDVRADEPVKKIRLFCSVKGCHNKHHGNGLCSKHWARKYRHGSVEISKYNREVKTGEYTKLPEYFVWQSMKSRCSNPNEKCYENYGGRGITVCDRWTEKPYGFKNFLTDMKKRPTPKHTIERINNDYGYFPDNCKWATRKENNNNRRPRKWGVKPI